MASQVAQTRKGPAAPFLVPKAPARHSSDGTAEKEVPGDLNGMTLARAFYSKNAFYDQSFCFTLVRSEFGGLLGDVLLGPLIITTGFTGFGALGGLHLLYQVHVS